MEKKSIVNKNKFVVLSAKFDRMSFLGLQAF